MDCLGNPTEGEPAGCLLVASRFSDSKPATVGAANKFCGNTVSLGLDVESGKFAVTYPAKGTPSDPAGRCSILDELFGGTQDEPSTVYIYCGTKDARPTTTTTTTTSSTATLTTMSTTTTITTTTMDAIAYKTQGIEVAALKYRLNMSASELLNKGFTVQELYDGGFTRAEIDAAGDEDAEFPVPEMYSAQYSTWMDSLKPEESSSVAAIVGALVAVIAVGIAAWFCYKAGGTCMGAGRSNDAPTNARISSFTMNPSYPQSSTSAAASSQMYGPTAESLYDGGSNNDEFSAATSAVTNVYESPSRQQLQVYDDAKVHGAAGHPADDGAYEEIERPYDEIDDDDIEL